MKAEEERGPSMLTSSLDPPYIQALIRSSVLSEFYNESNKGQA